MKIETLSIPDSLIDNNHVNILITDDLNPSLPNPENFKYNTIYLTGFKEDNTINNSSLFKSSVTFRRV